MRRCTLVLIASALGACFSPKVNPGASGSGSSTDASTGVEGSGDTSSGQDTTTDDPTISPETDTAVDTTVGETTVAGDEDPVVDSFTVNGSTTPAEVDEGGPITLEADASDDMGVVSVEFFDGETSLGVDEESPYALEVAVSSADSGSHAYRAVATDTVGQTGESDEVVLSINIVGGEVEILREELFRGIDGLTFVNGGLDSAMGDRVFLNAIIEEGGSSRVMAFNDDLSQIWSQLYPEQTPGRPVTVDDVLVIGGTDNEALTLVYRALSPETGETMQTLVLDTDATNSGGLFSYGRVARSGGLVVVNDSLQQLAAYDSGLSDRSWIANVGNTGDLAEFGENTFVSFGGGNNDCATGSTTCVRRYGPDGQSDWTTGLPINEPGLLATHPDGGAFAVVSLPENGYEVFRLEPTGELMSVATLDEGALQQISGARADGAGGLVVSGATGDYGSGRAFVTRLRGDGSVVWDQRQFFNGGVESAALDVDVDGASVFVYGLANNASDFLSFSGDTWIARVSL